MTSQQPIDQSVSASKLDTSQRGLDGLAPSAQQASDERPLREAVFAAMERYFDHLDGGTVTDLHAMVMAEVEAPLLSSVLVYTNGNQTRAAEMLGLNRGTLRKKLKHYELI
ncbi:DNA-binding transcriptional regulator Fis [Halomonas litopenaei]|uniref:DNA-binding transcriptional regulator Fis n=1 Tax=Halomonas litopenaei TaxID=2109328 RepID=UPI003FA1685F